MTMRSPDKPLSLTPDEVAEVTGYRQQAKQLEELHRQGFWRARRSITGRVILERAHYEAVCRGGDLRGDEPQLLPA